MTNKPGNELRNELLIGLAAFLVLIVLPGVLVAIYDSGTGFAIFAIAYAAPLSFTIGLQTWLSVDQQLHFDRMDGKRPWKD